MIPKIFLPVISLTLLFGGDSCHDDYNPDSFESAGDEFAEFIDEYFTEKSIPLSLTADILKKRGFKIQNSSWILPKCTLSKNNHIYPVWHGVWRVDIISTDLRRIHISLPYDSRVSQRVAFNRLNGMLGDIFADFDDNAYIMTMKPEDMRVRYEERYFEVNAYIYGTEGDGIALEKTVSDTVLTDYTKWVEENMKCREKR